MVTPNPTMVPVEMVWVGKLIEDMGMDDVPLSAVLVEIQARHKVRVAMANDKAKDTVNDFVLLSPTKTQICE
ncbi:hypothetical protein AMTRI_Chr02g217390 [Amborella trichopoda]